MALTGALIVALAPAIACDGERAHTDVFEPPSGAAYGEHPSSREAFLAELSPLPIEELLVVYEVRGPGELQGTLEVMLRPGGWRRENWRLALPVAGTEATLSGTTIQTPDAVYVEGPEGRRAVAAGLGALADAYLALDPDVQAKVVAGVRGMHAQLAQARARKAGAVDSVLGVECRPTRFAGQDLCMWESTGLPLRHVGGGFEVRAISIDRAPLLGANAFVIPPDVTAAPDPAPVDTAPALLALAGGGAPEIGAWLHPGVRLPGPWTTAG